MTSIGIIGSEGRMGVALAAAISEAGQRRCGIDKGGDVGKLAGDADVLVDFSSPAALEATLDACVAAKKPIVIGTTGLEERHHYLIDDAAADIAVSPCSHIWCAKRRRGSTPTMISKSSKCTTG
jgi:4-hydroxy-tetrahydrodipicolinate reductase